MELNLDGLENNSVYTYFQELSTEERGAWIAIALGLVFVIIGLFI